MKIFIEWGSFTTNCSKIYFVSIFYNKNVCMTSAFIVKLNFSCDLEDFGRILFVTKLTPSPKTEEMS